MLHKFLFFILLLSTTFLSNAQIGKWTEHLPFQSGTALASNGPELYCGTTTGLFKYDRRDNSLTRYSTVNGLSDIRIAGLAFNSTSNSLIIVYTDLNIDLLEGNSTFNLGFIKDSPLIGKTFESIYIRGSFAYLSTGFGIVKIDMVKKEISETYQFQSGGNPIKVNDCLIENNKIYAATDNGLYAASLTSNLLDFNQWTIESPTRLKNIKTLFSINMQPYAVVRINAMDSVFDLNTYNSIDQLTRNAVILIKNTSKGLAYVSNSSLTYYDENLTEVSKINSDFSYTVGVAVYSDKTYALNTFDPLLGFNNNGIVVDNIRPDGPFEQSVFDMHINDGVLWAVSGGHDGSINNQFKAPRVYKYEDGSWTSFRDFDNVGLEGTYDLLSINSSPTNSDVAYIGSWGPGLLKFQDGKFDLITDVNTTLQNRVARTDVNWIGIGEKTFDEEGNLYIVNSYVENAVSVLKTDGSWVAYNFPETIEKAAKEILITEGGLIYVTLPFDNNILVIDNKGTIDNVQDDESIILKQNQGEGNIPGGRGLTMAMDKNGQLWLGTSDGIAVHYNPDDVFNLSNRDFERIIIPNGPDNEILFGETEIVDIEVDGANRKWIATFSGVYLISADGKEEIAHFTTENSPLYSNSILDIAIDDNNGEVFISTSQGLISYQSDVIRGSESFSDVVVYPNPVRENYYGPIAIKGLLDQTTVKITDVNGQLVYELESQGGQAVWDGRNFDGVRVPTGVYLVFNSGENEEDDFKTNITKIMMVR